MSTPEPKQTGPMTDVEPKRTTLVGSVLDNRYEVLKQLGEGGMGTVYEARHRFLKTHVAIKLLKHADDEESLERLKREAQSASAIGNQHIVDVRDFGRTPDGTVYVAMELVEGEELFKLLQRGPLEWPRAVHIAKQIAQALGAAHAAGIVHRDLKAENVLLCERDGDADFVKVVDFGIAMIEGTSRITMAGRVMGTPQYMSPEQCAGVKVDHRTDIYALGILMFEMVTSKVPFNHADLAKLIQMQLSEAPRAPSAVNPFAELPAGYDAVVLRCLEKRSKDRYPDMAAVLDALEHIEEPVALAAPARATDEIATASPSTVPASRQPRSKTPALMAGAALAVLGVGLGVGAVVIEETGPAHVETPSPTIEAAPEPAIPEATDPAAPETPAPATGIEAITLASEPSGAEVYEDGALLGTTPLRVLRPSGDDRLRLEVRGDGFAPHPVVLSRMTADALSVSLEQAAPAGVIQPEPVPARVDPRPVRPRAPEGPTRPTKHREFRDPWD
ncbi:MAG: serine/threonine-protein kinase [Sandaracinaceae bacterium]